jgi:antitoxin VapB
MNIYYIECSMNTIETTVFQNGGSQAVRLPRGFRFNTKKVFIKKDNSGRLILSAKPTSWDEFFAQTPLPSDDFMQTRDDLPPQERVLFS